MGKACNSIWFVYDDLVPEFGIQTWVRPLSTKNFDDTFQFKM